MKASDKQSRFSRLRTTVKYPFARWLADRRLKRHRPGDYTFLLTLDARFHNVAILDALEARYRSQGWDVYISSFEDGSWAVVVR